MANVWVPNLYNRSLDLPPFPMSWSTSLVTPDDNVELVDVWGLWVSTAAVGGGSPDAIESGREDVFGKVTIRWEDDTTSALEFKNGGLGPFAFSPMPIKQVKATGTDIGEDGKALDGSTDRAGAVYTGNHVYVITTQQTHIIPNRPPEFLNLPARVDIPTNAQTQVLFTARASDPDFDDLTWSTVGTNWPSYFTLATTGADAGQVTYTRGADDLDEAAHVLLIGINDGTNDTVTGQLTIAVYDSA